LATSIAKRDDATLVFIYVAPQWLPEEAMLSSDYVRSTVAADKQVFLDLRPTDESVAYEHLFVDGNPGPEIVRASKNCDLVVMSTHGRSGILRFLMGSVAQYVLRHTTCPVISFKASQTTRLAESNERQPKHFITDVMHHVSPIRGFQQMETVIAELDQAKQTGAPVVDDLGCCIGILTKSDIDKYRELQKRYEERDETVIDEIFETDGFGQRRAGNRDFDQVHRHMTSPAVTIANTATCQKAQLLFDHNSDIHHLVVVDDSEHPIGILTTTDLKECEGVSPGTRVDS
jgi:nucleotide-binding universal stress UspA family protein/CBS domain-containing protein